MSELQIYDQRIVFLGMFNPRVDEPLWPAPSRSTGHTLWRLINEAVGWDRETYLARTTRINFKKDAANIAPDEVFARRDHLQKQLAGRRVICIGVVTARIMDAPLEPFEWDEMLSSMPSTSGLNRFWNVQENWDHAVQFLKEALT